MFLIYILFTSFFRSLYNCNKKYFVILQFLDDCIYQLITWTKQQREISIYNLKKIAKQNRKKRKKKKLKSK